MKSSKLTCRFASCSSPSTWIETAVSQIHDALLRSNDDFSRYPRPREPAAMAAAITGPEMARDRVEKRFLCNCFIMYPAVRQP
jgi:hypothetical protein